MRWLWDALGFVEPIGASAPRSAQWPKVRADWLLLHPTCAACGTKKDLEVHHIAPVWLFPSHELDPQNLITLCGGGCHFAWGHLHNYRSWNPTVVVDTTAFLAKVQSRA